MSSEQIHFERIRNEIIEQTSNRLVQVLFIKIFYHHVKKSAYLEGIKFSRNIWIIKHDFNLKKINMKGNEKVFKWFCLNKEDTLQLLSS
jgi:hypothetical protein